jgi:hypothetical protein
MKLKTLAITTLILIGIGGVAAAIGTRTPAVDPAPKCDSPDARIVMDLGRHTLTLCEKTMVVRTFPVRLGRGGVGKTKEDRTALSAALASFGVLALADGCGRGSTPSRFASLAAAYLAAPGPVFLYSKKRLTFTS